MIFMNEHLSLSNENVYLNILMSKLLTIPSYQTLSWLEEIQASNLQSRHH
ncbi:hypothetical protein Lalb_Chr17g0337181 [Lupinus albus]|uniref:Uncharacterized protein n=1 Tax=Lupinus albus TaxID=3870 RepID=A0A6A4NYF0_LUPAL|nr:hypothetical protein Lalb_Chr17g0337181 [Lupinus albus]